MIKIQGEIVVLETMAEGHGIRELNRLCQQYGHGHWRKKKGIAIIELNNGATAPAEVHWYEAHGIGRVKMKIKRWL